MERWKPAEWNLYMATGAKVLGAFWDPELLATVSYEGLECVSLGSWSASGASAGAVDGLEAADV